jgi:diketogulonate reductase-like aldo/keto reductase
MWQKYNTKNIISITMSNYFNTQIGFGTAGLGLTNQWSVGKSAMHHALAIGYKVFDTAEMYSNGNTETMIGEVLDESRQRDQLHIVSKVLPKNATTKESIIASCKASIQRMNCDYIDTYLLHWRDPDNLPLQPIIEAFLELQHLGLIKKYGVSNFNSQRSLKEWMQYETQLGTTEHIVANQIHYSLSKRTPETDLTELHKTSNIDMMAYSPLSNGRNNILKNSGFFNLALKYNCNPTQLAVAWTIRNPGIIVIPASKQHKHIEDNLASEKLQLNKEILDELDQLFPL